MARTITHTLILEGELVAQTPIHIGGADSGDTIDMPLATDGKGRYYLPGSSIAGAIRAWEQGTDDNWGHADKKEGHASFIIVDDAPATAEPIAELWHGVGIDRRTGGASKGIKFDRQILPQGTRFKFRFQREVPEGSRLQQFRIQMQQLRQALEQGDIPFGGSTTRGFGRLDLKNACASEIEWETRTGILDWLKHGAGSEAANLWQGALQEVAHTPPAASLTIDIHWQPKGPLMSRSAQDGISADTLPFISRNHDGKYALTLPGSSIKGALRQQAERIMRTVLGLDVRAGQHADQVDVPLASLLFGAARGKDEIVGGTTRQTGGAKGLLAVDTCYAEFSLSDTQWSALDAGEEPWSGKLYKADHVAIDRWTGAASDGALFNTVEPDKTVPWKPIRLRFDLRRGKKALPALALLWLVIQDMQQGRIPLGFGVNRGYGDLQVNKIEVRGLSGLGQQGLPDTQSLDADWSHSPLYSLLKQAWAEWLAAQPKKEAA